MAAPFDPTAESHRARGLAHQFKQDAGLVFPEPSASLPGEA
jgi:hypothetical protein